MPEKMTFEEAMELGRALPRDIWLDQRGRPLLTREQWEKLGRWRRRRDVLLGWDPPVRPQKRPPD
jgi:hypothetical protein